MVICSACQLLTAAKVLWLALSFMGQSQQGRVISQPRALRWTRWPDIAHKRICRMSPGTIWRLPYHPLSPQWHRQEVTNVQAGLWVDKMPRAERGKKKSHNEKTMFGWHTANKRSQGHYAAFNKQCLRSDECSPVPEHAHTAETMQWSTIFFPQRKKKIWILDIIFKQWCCLMIEPSQHNNISQKKNSWGGPAFQRNHFLVQESRFQITVYDYFP